MNERELLFNQLKSIKDYWVKTSVESLEEESDLIWSEHEEAYARLQELIKLDSDKEFYANILNEILKGAIHSILVMVDGGDSLSDKYNLDLVNSDTNKSIKENTALHEEFFSYLLDEE
jgi:hypothetical protein